jgi:hypothetical protein
MPALLYPNNTSAARREAGRGVLLAKMLWRLRPFPDFREPYLPSTERLRSRDKGTTASGSWRRVYGLFVPDVC